MDPAEFGRGQQIRCASCGQITTSYEIVNYGSMEHGYRQLCSQCFNTEVAETAGLEGFEHAKFEPVGLADCTGEVHEFHFRTNLFGTGVALNAFELRDGNPAGYQFQIIGNPEDDLLVSARTEKRTFLNAGRCLGVNEHHRRRRISEICTGRTDQHHRRRRFLGVSIIAAGALGERRIW